jgi:anti-anti-sigma regulatory factor
MNGATASLAVWIGEKAVCVKVSGRANFKASSEFKTLINGLWERGYHRYVLDLTECVLMDSTFVGVLAGLGLKLTKNQNGNGPGCIELLNPNQRIADLLDNLGMALMYRIVRGPQADTTGMAHLDQSPAAPDHVELSRTCLEAHQTLMDLNPENEAKFKEVAKFLAEDLQKLERQSPTPKADAKE